MDTNQSVLNNANSDANNNSNNAPAFTERLRHSKALIPTMAVMGVTVMALAAALVVNRSGATRQGLCPAACRLGQQWQQQHNGCKAASGYVKSAADPHPKKQKHPCADHCCAILPRQRLCPLRHG